MRSPWISVINNAGTGRTNGNSERSPVIRLRPPAGTGIPCNRPARCKDLCSAILRGLCKMKAPLRRFPGHRLVIHHFLTASSQVVAEERSFGPARRKQFGSRWRAPRNPGRARAPTHRADGLHWTDNGIRLPRRARQPGSGYAAYRAKARATPAKRRRALSTYLASSSIPRYR